jgi:hypothetical protein
MADTSLADLLKTLSPTQLEFVQARMFASSDAEAARESGIAVSTVYGWPNLADVRECVKLSKMDGITVAQEKLRRLASRAVDVIADEMTAKRGSSKRLEAAMTALDRLGVDVKQTIRQQVQASVQLSAADLIAALQDAERAGSSDGAE